MQTVYSLFSRIGTAHLRAYQACFERGCAKKRQPFPPAAAKGMQGQHCDMATTGQSSAGVEFNAHDH